MVLKNFVKSQLVEVIEWVDDSTDTLVYRFPVAGQEIKMGAQLTVREGQLAVFVNEGRIADTFEPGRHRLATRNMPVLTKLLSWKHGFTSPFKAEIYFVSARQFTDQKWGTSNPVMMRDPELGPIRLRASGIYSFKVRDAASFMTDIVGTEGHYTTDEIAGQLRRLIVSGFSDLLAESNIPALDLATKYDELSDTAKTKLDKEFETHGLELTKLYVENISLLPEVEKMLDKRTSMGVVGDLNELTPFHAAQAMEAAAKNSGGAAGAGIGLGAGMAMGNAMASSLAKPQAGAPATASCVKCSQPIQDGAPFCQHCGTPQGSTCGKCQTKLPAEAKFCPNCGSRQSSTCSKCESPLTPGAKFCSSCGTASG